MPVRRLDPAYLLELASKLDPKKYVVRLEQNRDVKHQPVAIGERAMIVGPTTTSITIEELKCFCSSIG